LDLEANRQGLEGKIINNHENGKEYVEIIKTPYWNLMLDRQVLRIKERHVGHMSFLSQGLVSMKYGLVVFREGKVIDGDLHGKRCS
jgi:hypothetical protein